jgi:Fe2+ transport system protein FeoA
MTLDQIKTGETAVISAVGGEGALRCRLLDMGLIPKTKVKLQKVAPMGDPIEIHLRGYELTLRVEDAQKIEVVALDGEDAGPAHKNRRTHAQKRDGAA